MKKGILIMATCLMGLGSFAQVTREELQISQGTAVVSVDVPWVFSHSRQVNPNGTTSNSQSFTFKPMVSGGYFVRKNFMIGGGFGVMKTWNRSKSPAGFVNENSSPTFLMPAFLMRYYYIFSPKVGFYGQYELAGVLQPDGPQPRENGFNMALSPRFVFFPISAVGLNAGIGEVAYAFRAYDTPGDGVAPAHTHDFMVLPTVHFGASFFINR